MVIYGSTALDSGTWDDFILSALPKAWITSDDPAEPTSQAVMSAVIASIRENVAQVAETECSDKEVSLSFLLFAAFSCLTWLLKHKMFADNNFS